MLKIFQIVPQAERTALSVWILPEAFLLFFLTAESGTVVVLWLRFVGFFLILHNEESKCKSKCLFLHIPLKTVDTES